MRRWNGRLTKSEHRGNTASINNGLGCTSAEQARSEAQTVGEQERKQGQIPDDKTKALVEIQGWNCKRLKRRRSNYSTKLCGLKGHEIVWSKKLRSGMHTQARRY